MSQPVAVSSHLSGLITAGHRRSAVPALSPRPASSHRFHRVPCPNPWPPHQAETTPRAMAATTASRSASKALSSAVWDITACDQRSVDGVKGGLAGRHAVGADDHTVIHTAHPSLEELPSGHAQRGTPATDAVVPIGELDRFQASIMHTCHAVTRSPSCSDGKQQ